MRTKRATLALLLLSPILLCCLMPSIGMSGAEPHRSFNMIVTSNGYSPSIYEAESNRLTGFYDHLYKNFNGASPTTDLCWDAYWGVNIAGRGMWLTEVDEDAVGYDEGTGIIHVERHHSGLRIDEYYFSPFDFNGSILVMAIKVTNETTVSINGSLYLLLNFHTGSGAPEAGFDSEVITWDNGQFHEIGISTGHTFIYKPVVLPHHRRADFSASEGNPYLLIDNVAMPDKDSTDGPGDDAICAFQWYLAEGGELPPGQSLWQAVVIVYEKNPDIDEITTKITEWIGSRDVRTILNDERESNWQSWLSISNDILASAISDPVRSQLAKASLVMLRMGQVREANSSEGTPHGQIVASIPPGMWNITWPRDQSYAISALSEAGYYDEARWAVEFVLNGRAGSYGSYFGITDYLVSVCRYFGNGAEESDGNPAVEGPNIEFDNFGLFLWSTWKYVTNSGDYSIVEENSDRIFGLTADVLVKLIDPSVNLLKPDSSIWERHWNGREKHFAYSNITAVAGLCGAAKLAFEMGNPSLAEKYVESARTIYQGIIENLMTDENFIAQSLEEISSGQFFDASVVEAINLGLFDATSDVYTTLMDKFDSILWINTTDRGYARNDDGDWYDSQEWVFIDLRIALARRFAGEMNKFSELIDWVTFQSQQNMWMIAELYDNTNADYAGSVPMMGFGAGAYLLAVLEEKDKATSLIDWCMEVKITPEEEIEEQIEQVEQFEEEPELVGDGLEQETSYPEQDTVEEADEEDLFSSSGCSCRFI